MTVGGGFTLGISGILSCLETDTGRLLWRKDFRGQFRETSPIYGAAMSPVVDGGLLIAHVGGHDDGALTAFDVATGNVKWAWKGDGPGYASPVVADLGGRRQVVTQTQGHVVGVALEGGELLWKIPLRTDYEQNAVTPVIHGQDVIYSGLGKGIHAVRIAKRAGGWVAEPQWENLDLSMYMSSPVLDGDRLYGFSHRQKGQAFCLDARTGKALWTGPGRRGENAALIRGGNELFLLTTDAQLLVARADAAELAPLATYNVAGSPTWAQPVILAGGILVKDAETLALWQVE
ncbi:MAG: PQQ-binding-like beta-propeller repeat protein [Gemmatimonadales bacterium]